MSTKHQITRAAELGSLASIRSFIDSVCETQPSIDPATVYDLKLAVDEACTNIITHGYAGMNPGSIMVELELEPDRVLVNITDFGHAFEPSEAPVPDIDAALEDRPMGGFGLFMIYQTMDQVDYETTGYCNRLTFIKKLPTPSE